MPIRQKIVFLLITGLLLLAVVELVRRRRLRVEYSWLWLLSAFTIIGLILRYDVLIALTGFVGAVIPTSTLFFLCILFLVLLNIHYSVQITTLGREVKDLAQELAILRAEVGAGIERDHT